MRRDLSLFRNLRHFRHVVIPDWCVGVGLDASFTGTGSGCILNMNNNLALFAPIFFLLMIPPLNFLSVQC